MKWPELNLSSFPFNGPVQGRHPRCQLIKPCKYDPFPYIDPSFSDKPYNPVRKRGRLNKPEAPNLSVIYLCPPLQALRLLRKVDIFGKGDAVFPNQRICVIGRLRNAAA